MAATDVVAHRAEAPGARRARYFAGGTVSVIVKAQGFADFSLIFAISTEFELPARPKFHCSCLKIPLFGNNRTASKPMRRTKYATRLLPCR